MGSRRHDQGHSAARTQQPEDRLESTRWIAQFAEALRASGRNVFLLEDPIFQAYAVNEQRVTGLLHGTGGQRILAVSAVFVNPDGSRAPERWQDRMEGVRFSHREYELVG